MAKKPIILKAAKMRRKPMQYLYENYKKQIYSLCLLLTQDNEQAQAITKKAFLESWDALKRLKLAEDEDFYKLAAKAAAKGCQINDLKGIKSEPRLKIDIEREKYTGDAKNGFSLYTTAAAKMPREDMVLIILYFAGRLDYRDISEILRVRKGVLKGAHQNAAANFSVALNKVSVGGARSDTPTVNQLRSFYREYAKTLSFPEALDKECLWDIKKKAKFRLW